MSEERVMDKVSGSIWGPPGPSKKPVFTRVEEEDMCTDRLKERKAKYHTKIMGELEAFVERPAEEWGDEEEQGIIDMLDLIEHSMKAQLSSNNPEYVG